MGRLVRVWLIAQQPELILMTMSEQMVLIRSSYGAMRKADGRGPLREVKTDRRTSQCLKMEWEAKSLSISLQKWQCDLKASRLLHSSKTTWQCI